MWRLLRENRDVRLLCAAQVVSFAGDWFAYVAFVGLVQDFGGSGLLVTLVYVAQALPAFFTSPVAGPVADHHDRRVVIITVSLGQAVAAAGLLLVRSPGLLWVGYVSLCLISALGAFVGPASGAGLPNLTRNAEELRAASLLFGSLWGVMLAVGAALGGLVAAQFGRTTAFVANVCSFLLAALLVRMITRPLQQARPADAPARSRLRPIADMADAARVVRADGVLGALLASKATFGVSSGIVGLLAALATRHFGGTDSATGLLIAARGVGVGAGPLIAARLLGPSLSRVLLMAGTAGIAFGACYLGVSAAPTLLVAALFTMAAHIGGGAQWTMSTYGLQRRAADAVRGRVLAADFALATVTISLSNVAAGILADRLGVRRTIAVFALITMLGSLAYLTLTRHQRRALAAEERGWTMEPE